MRSGALGTMTAVRAAPYSNPAHQMPITAQPRAALRRNTNPSLRHARPQTDTHQTHPPPSKPRARRTPARPRARRRHPAARRRRERRPQDRGAARGRRRRARQGQPRAHAARARDEGQGRRDARRGGGQARQGVSWWRRDEAARADVFCPCSGWIVCFFAPQCPFRPAAADPRGACALRARGRFLPAPASSFSPVFCASSFYVFVAPLPLFRSLSKLPPSLLSSNQNNASPTPTPHTPQEDVQKDCAEMRAAIGWRVTGCMPLLPRQNSC